MPIINPTLPNDGEDIDASDVNDPINAILAVLNGLIDQDNIADSAIILSKLSSSLQQSLVPTGMLAPYGGTTAPSAGWLLCYGQAVSRSTYSSLFAVLGTAFGTGDGSTTFNLPDLRGRVPVGLDNIGGTAANRIQKSSTLTTTNASPTATIGSATDISIGMYVESTNVPDGTTIIDISGTTVTLSANATAAGTNTAARFSMLGDAQEMGDAGGSQVHTLITNQLAAHGHSFQASDAGGSALYAGKGNGINQVTNVTTTSGGGQPHPNVQPGQLMNYIIKT